MLAMAVTFFIEKDIVVPETFECSENVVRDPAFAGLKHYRWTTGRIRRFTSAYLPETTE